MKNTMPSTMKGLKKALLTSTAICALSLATPQVVLAQTVETPPGVYLELSGQYSMSLADFEYGLVNVPNYPIASTDDGDGWAGSVTIGNKWANGFHAAVRFSMIDTDNSNRSAAGIYTYNPTYTFFSFPNSTTKTDSKYQALEFEAGKEFGLGSGRIQVFGGLQYVDVERNVRTTGPLNPGVTNFVNSDFSGIGPFAGVRGSLPIRPGVTLVGGMKLGALYGESEYSTRIRFNGTNYFPFKDGDHRVAGTVNLEAGVAFQVGPGSITFGYSFDALYGALDMDARVGTFYAGYQFGDSTDEFVNHGPFIKATVPLGNLR